MKKSTLVLGLGLALLIFSGSDVLPQAPKEITETITLSWNGTSKVIPLGEGSNVSTFEVFGVLISDEGKGLFHEATYHAVGSALSEKGILKKYMLHGYYLLKNGDKVFIAQTRDEPKAGTPPAGRNTIIGGTGKCAGIQGSWQYTAFFLRPIAQGMIQGYHKHPIKYTLP